MIKIYRYLLSPFFGWQCRFYPSCSHYCQVAIERHGVLKGLFLSIKRFLRCHPFCQGGVDEVP